VQNGKAGGTSERQEAPVHESGVRRCVDQLSGELGSDANSNDSDVTKAHSARRSLAAQALHQLIAAAAAAAAFRTPITPGSGAGGRKELEVGTACAVALSEGEALEHSRGSSKHQEEAGCHWRCYWRC
jgi:hypothetical protein